MAKNKLQEKAIPLTFSLGFEKLLVAAAAIIKNFTFWTRLRAEGQECALHLCFDKFIWIHCNS